jgi:hypothetical protein
MIDAQKRAVTGEGVVDTREGFLEEGTSAVTHKE